MALNQELGIPLPAELDELHQSLCRDHGPKGGASAPEGTGQTSSPGADQTSSPGADQTVEPAASPQSSAMSDNDDDGGT